MVKSPGLRATAMKQRVGEFHATGRVSSGNQLSPKKTQMYPKEWNGFQTRTRTKTLATPNWRYFHKWFTLSKMCSFLAPQYKSTCAFKFLGSFFSIYFRGTDAGSVQNSGHDVQFPNPAKFTKFLFQNFLTFPNLGTRRSLCFFCPAFRSAKPSLPNRPVDPVKCEHEAITLHTFRPC